MSHLREGLGWFRIGQDRHGYFVGRPAVSYTQSNGSYGHLCHRRGAGVGEPRKDVNTQVTWTNPGRAIGKGDRHANR
jgi:hypothetical protein